MAIRGVALLHTSWFGSRIPRVSFQLAVSSAHESRELRTPPRRLLALIVLDSSR